jgi:hypothetical protein
VDGETEPCRNWQWQLPGRDEPEFEHSAIRWIVKRLVATGDSKHGNASLSMKCFWAGLGEHMPNAEWAVGFTAFLEMSQSAANWE